ncbi:hypothetical protein [Marinoscillum sp. 108]|uniref:hypothetical protein n=1 Tax=Marinoscillum sp. 108 TaxID=2653151 RepID=UPI0012F07F07|nr:hypothetical protein [Marinoscillum sp. 108]VXD14251.1 hypothetical protein MARINOS108_11826 [Marinoscillum sp. 108]
MVKTIKKQVGKQASIRVNIDKTWSANEFATFFRSFESLYSLYLFYFEGCELVKNKKKNKTYYAKQQHTPLFHFLATKSLISSFYHEEGIFQDGNQSFITSTSKVDSGLSVTSIRFSSPGFTDFTGLSGVVGHLKEVFMYYFPNKLAKEEIKIKQQKRVNLQIKNLKAMGFSSTDIKKIVLLEEMTIDKMKLLIDEGKITSIESNNN